jgi:hypothetical protein
MKMSGQLHVPAALLPEKEPKVPNGQEAGWAPESVRTRWREENVHSLLLPGIETSVEQPAA